jgi:hypothetical protein
MLDEKVFQLKAELRKMTKGNLLRMVLSQKERKCVLGGVCPFLFQYQRTLFCVSEILGQGCQIEKQRLDSVQEARSEREFAETCGTASRALASGLLLIQQRFKRRGT